MRILQFYFAELGHVGGVEMTVLQLTEAFTQRGHTAGILEFANGWKPRRVIENSIPVWGIGAPSFPRWHRPRSWASFVRATWQFGNVIREFGPDIVHVHYPLSQALPIFGAAFFAPRWRLVVTLHGSEIRVSPSATPQIRPWQARLLKAAAAVTAVNETLLVEARQKYPEMSRNSLVIPNGVRSEWFAKPSTSENPANKYILFVGRLHPVKGADLLLQAWKELSPRFPGYELWLVGDGPERESLQELTDHLAIESSVQFIGLKSHQELAQLYRCCEAYVIPSRSEGLPLCLLEAGASGALCVGARIPGVEAILEEGVTGYLADAESPESLASAIERAVKASLADQERIRNSLQTLISGNYSEESVTTRYLDLFESVLQKGH